MDAASTLVLLFLSHFFLHNATNSHASGASEVGFSIKIIHRDSPESPFHDPASTSFSRHHATIHSPAVAQADKFHQVSPPNPPHYHPYQGNGFNISAEIFPVKYNYLMKIEIGEQHRGIIVHVKAATIIEASFSILRTPPATLLSGAIPELATCSSSPVDPAKLKSPLVSTVSPMITISLSKAFFQQKHYGLKMIHLSDTGTHITYINRDAMIHLSDELVKIITNRRVDVPEHLAKMLNLCFDWEIPIDMPKITFMFHGGAVVHLVDPFMLVKNLKIMCLVIASNDLNNEVSIFGNNAQMDHHIGFNLKEHRITIRPPSN